MPRYSVSREKFPIEQKFKGTAEHQRRVRSIATYYNISQQEVIRRGIDYFYTILFFVTNGSVDRSDRQTSEKAQEEDEIDARKSVLFNIERPSI